MAENIWKNYVRYAGGGGGAVLWLVTWGKGGIQNCLIRYVSYRWPLKSVSRIF